MLITFRAANTAVDSDYHRAAWLVFCTNQPLLDTAVQDGARAGAQFRVVGHPKADHLRAVAPAWPRDRPGNRGPAGWPGRRNHTIGRGWTDFGVWMRDWGALPDTAVLSEADYGPALAASDLTVTDGPSMLVEYQLFGKPVVRPSARVTVRSTRSGNGSCAACTPVPTLAEGGCSRKVPRRPPRPLGAGNGTTSSSCSALPVASPDHGRPAAGDGPRR